MSEDTQATELTRRRMLQGAAAALTVATGTVVIGLAGPGGGAATAADPGASDSFDEVFQGRRIQGRPAAGGSHHHGGGTGTGGGTGYEVRIDGDELHMMRNADGTWISVVNHYQTFATPRALARAAVNDLQGATLVPVVTV
ncbi:tyrosinase cofactor [Kitasatospora purpeofusca]|uniref:apotyrosinase chaperone MelC1 n=1 Tax=Streptomycetaceae TaxID=2062 RepID=UPI00087B9A24|nr:tyrosinase cofactor [Streptomyces sp. TLI_053]SDT17009.1 Tyrosinase co-factor MelC1 [Streptomyces sp. TLI_053]